MLEADHHEVDHSLQAKATVVTAAAHSIDLLFEPIVVNVWQAGWTWSVETREVDALEKNLESHVRATDHVEDAAARVAEMSGKDQGGG